MARDVTKIRHDKRQAPRRERTLSAMPRPVLFKTCLANVAPSKPLELASLIRMVPPVKELSSGI